MNNTTDSSSSPLRLAVIVGSTREGRFGPVVANWFTERARVHGDMDVDVIDLAETELPARLSHTPDPEAAAALGALSPRLAAADAFVVITPEYNHSYPASLKTAIDWFRDEWQAKPVGFVSYGGLSGGLRAVEHLRPVFAELHTVTVRETVSFHTAWNRFDENGHPLDEAGANGAAKTMLDQIAWWAQALRTARAVRPYGS
ncbi:NADPH-dependent FMN reductase [Streptomyces palmae]|uniref:NADPH-dependent oxidoreductase n=1 Tax=Streptomyces palmae TaxID=1701085 RepID=A0A4Z0GUU0_9ACTN|nr:NAD(P)H-dependent oxidoreductase [Streptomyces palmae]TGB00495.1 NADPH-dependent oxidoreductase [Streptomyces palmae]